ncbi:hypothetical protein V5799_003041, partial [Amblyomma americanum]
MQYDTRYICSEMPVSSIYAGCIDDCDVPTILEAAEQSRKRRRLALPRLAGEHLHHQPTTRLQPLVAVPARQHPAGYVTASAIWMRHQGTVMLCFRRGSAAVSRQPHTRMTRQHRSFGCDRLHQDSSGRLLFPELGRLACPICKVRQ